MAHFVKLPIIGDGIDLDLVTAIFYAPLVRGAGISSEQLPRVVVHTACNDFVIECDSVDSAIKIRDDLVAEKQRGNAAANPSLVADRDDVLRRVAALEEERGDLEMAADALNAIHELLDSCGIPRGTFSDDHVRNLVALYKQRGARIAELEAELAPVRQIRRRLSMADALQADLARIQFEAEMRAREQGAP